MNHETNTMHTARAPRWLGLASTLTIACLVAVTACSSEDSSASTPATTDDAAAGASGAAGADAAPAEDSAAEAATEDAGPEAATYDAAEEASAEAGLACEPQSVAGWTPTWHPPTGLYQGKCGPGVVAAVMEGCFASTATKTKCDNVQKAYPDCMTCLFSRDTDPVWGPLVKFTELNIFDRNDSGCYALIEGDVSATGCGSKIQAHWECVHESCKPGCKIGTTTVTKDLAAFNGCVKKASADPATCKAYNDDFKACFAADPKYLVCQWKVGEAWDVVAARISELFCGVAPDSDAGASDAPVDN